VQNAAVHVGPGDVLRFGARGASFELMVDGVPQVRQALKWACGLT